MAILVALFALGMSASAGIRGLQGGRDHTGWWVVFYADDEGGYTGLVFHAHIYDPGEADDMLRYGLGVASLAFGLVPMGKIPALVTSVIALAAESAVNSDGSYDFYIFQGSKKGLFDVQVPFSFSGFVSDQWWKPPISVEINNVLVPMNTFIILWAKEMGDFFRSRPTPPS